MGERCASRASKPQPTCRWRATRGRMRGGSAGTWQGGGVLGGAGALSGSQMSIQQSMQQLTRRMAGCTPPNGRLHATAAASQHRYESALTALHARAVALKALEATFVALQASTPPFPHSAATHPPP